MKYTLILITLVAITFSCKKGKEDPFLSLLSRKSRIVREWKIEQFNFNFKNRQETNGNVSDYFSDLILDGENITINSTPSGINPGTVNGIVISANWNIVKDYNWTKEITYQIIDNTTTTTITSLEKGIWAFMHKSENRKNREFVSINLLNKEEKVTTNNNGTISESVKTTEYTEGEEIESYSIIMLRNNEIKMEYNESTIVNTPSGTTVDITNNKSFILKK
jgi:hypothetical protein